MITCSRCLLLLIGALLTVAAFAEEPRQVMWADLVPKSAAFDNPFLKLTAEQLARLKPGEAFVWSSKSTDQGFSREAVKVTLRPRATLHGGATKTAV
jgi:hypothetical protein